MNVFTWHKPSGFTASDLAALNAAIHTAWTAHIAPIQPNTLLLEYLESTALDAEAAPQDILTVNSTGGENTVLAPNNVTVAVKFTSGLTGRSNRGRMFFIGLSPGSVLGNVITTTAAAAILAAIPAFFAQVLSLASATHVVISYCGGKVWRTTAQVVDITGYTLVDSNVDSQRRRLNGRGI